MTKGYSKKLGLIFILIFIITQISFGDPSFRLIYVVQEGDTISEITAEYNISKKRLMEKNNLEKGSVIRVGQELLIPEPTEEDPDFNLTMFHEPDFVQDDLYLDVGNKYPVRINPGHKKPDISKIPKNKIVTYHVGVGDTLYDLAHSFNTTTGVIMALNKMENSVLRKGDTIKLPTHNLTPIQVMAKTVKESDIELLARAIHGEARGEPYIGQVAVGAVIINRVLSSYFPDTFQEVIYQGRQFSAVADGQIHLSPNSTAYRAAREAIKGSDPTMGSLYYYNPKFAKNQWWFERRRQMVTIGEHVFTK
ncbi:MAG: cell wall hydrolase [Halanaerobiales bacterium]